MFESIHIHIHIHIHMYICKRHNTFPLLWQSPRFAASLQLTIPTVLCSVYVWDAWNGGRPTKTFYPLINVNKKLLMAIEIVD